VLDHQMPVLVIAIATLALTALLYVVIPKGLFPTQDTGQIQADVRARESVSFSAMGDLQQAIAQKILADPDVASLSSYIGVDGASSTALSSGRMLINLKPHGERGALQDIMDRLRLAAATVPGARLYLQPVQDLTIDAETGPTEYLERQGHRRASERAGGRQRGLRCDGPWPRGNRRRRPRHRVAAWRNGRERR
jgi:multidrug efflux pump